VTDSDVLQDVFAQSLKNNCRSYTKWVDGRIPTIIARRIWRRLSILSHVKRPAALDSKRSDAGGVNSVMIHLCSLRLTRLPSISALPRGRATSRVFILTILRILTDYRYLLYTPFIPSNRCCLLKTTHRRSRRFSLMSYLHLFLVLKVKFMDIAVLTSNS